MELNTRAMATITTQNASGSQERTPVRRLTKNECTMAAFDETEVQVFCGAKTPKMPTSHATVNVPPLKMLCQIVISREKAEGTDFDYLKESASGTDIPDYNGFNNKMKRNERHKSNIFISR